MIEAFQPMLVASWLEAAPSVFISTNTIAMTPALELVYEILKISVIMWRAAVSSQKVSTLSASWLDRHLQTTLRHFHVYFPFGADALGNRGSKVDDVLMQMNILFCELTSLYLLARTMQKNNLRLESRKTMPESNMAPEWTQNVVGHVLGVLGCDGQDEVMSSTSSSFRAEHLVSLLPAIWGFLNCIEESEVLFEAVMGFQRKCQTASTKKIASDFIVHIETVSDKTDLAYLYLTCLMYRFK